MNSCRIWIHAKIPDSELARLSVAFPFVEFVSDNEAENQLESLDAVFTEDPLPDASVERMNKLRWLHVTRGGASAFLTPAVKASPMVLTCSKGIHGLRFAELALASMFALAKRLPQCWEEQRGKRWAKVSPEEISGKTVGILGLGTIGSELARKAKALGMRVLATKRQASNRPAYVDELGTPEFLPALLSQSDFVVISLASIHSTENMLGERELRSLKKTAFLINLTGARVIQEAVLIRALKEGWFAGAALDTFSRRPIPEDSELWNMPNVTMTFGIGGFSARKWDELLPIFTQNLRLFLEGKKLLNAVDKQLGY
jgi:phosphoglycerate dehydrogenase-like enzyme